MAPGTCTSRTRTPGSLPDRRKPMGSPAVLILSHPTDVHADAVQEHLDGCGVQVRRVDTDVLGALTAPVTAHLNGGAVTGDVAGVSLDRIVGVWHRRPSEFPAADERDAAELRAGIGGILAGLPHLNHPADMAVAAFKPYQLLTASRCGLPVPETMVSTVRPVAAAMAARCHGGVVVKPMSRFAAGLVDEHDGSGCWWFLEANPNGQWLWLEHATGLPIAAAVATALRQTRQMVRPVALAVPS